MGRRRNLPLIALIGLASAWSRAAPAADPRRSHAEPAPSATALRGWHDLLGSEPHVAGTPGDAREIDRLRIAFESLGLETHVHDIFPLLARPVDASLEIVGAEGGAPSGGPVAVPERGARRGIVPLGLRERNLLEDPATAHPDLTWGWNAYSASGAVEAEVVYANLGRAEDFRRLRELGIEVEGRIAIARYGGGFRGGKARAAEDAGAAGLLLFLDPGDVGDKKGPTYPAGGWANDTCIQRGSVLSLPYPGDPLTPGTEATRDGARLDAAEVALPRILVQPIGYGATAEILSRMEGAPAPDDWQGGLPTTYRLEGGAGLRLRLRVEQARTIAKTSNIIASVPGATMPDELVVVGCHHDAWGFGAADPLAGTIVLLECARAMSEAAAAGSPPARTVVFAAWGAEEFGIIGSTEWVEANAESLAAHAVAYVNLDMASMGPSFGARASPSLGPAIRAAMARVPQARQPDITVLDDWTKRSGAEAMPPVTGGGSDHVGFLCHLAIPSCELSAGGSAGTSYHSNYDTLNWYRMVVGDDYEPALMVSRVALALVEELAGSSRVPLDTSRYAPAIRSAAARLAEDSLFADRPLDIADLERACDRLEVAWHALEQAKADGRIGARESNEALIRAERALLIPAGLSDRPWFRSAFVATASENGYSAVLLPLVAEAVRDGDRDRAIAALDALTDCVLAMADELATAASPTATR